MNMFIVFVSALTCLSLDGISQIENAGTATLLQKADSAQAVEHLYKRKRGWGIAKIAISSVFGGIAVAKITEDDPGKGQVSTGPDLNSFLFIGISTGLLLDGIAQTSRYSKKKLEKQLTRYKAGKRLPASIRSKLRKRDFS
jgi:hypothetical protein